MPQKFNKNNKNRFFAFLRLLFVLTTITYLLYLIMQNKRRNDESFVIDKSLINYTIGLIESYGDATGGFQSGAIESSPKMSQVNYSYIINNKKFEDFDYGVPKVKEGDRFLVVYYIKNQQKSLILFNYPIKDSTDYKRYMDEFKTKTPKIYPK